MNEKLEPARSVPVVNNHPKHGKEGKKDYSSDHFWSPNYAKNRVLYSFELNPILILQREQGRTVT